MTDTPTTVPDDTTDTEPTVTATEPGRTKPRSAIRRGTRRPSPTALAAVVAGIAAVGFAVLWATDDSADRLAALRSQQQTTAKAEDVASQYALNVSKVDYNNIAAWRTALESGVTEQLKSKMDAAVNIVGPLLTEMQYTSTAKPLAATVSQHNGDQYVVQVFIDMNSRSRQTPTGINATASYTITLDRASNWTITDVGGIGAGLPGTGTPRPSATPGR